MDRGRPLEHHRLRHGRLRRQAARHAPPVAAGRAVPALPPGHASGVLATARSRSTPAPTSTTPSTTRRRRSTTPTSRRSSRTNPSFAGDQSDELATSSTQRVVGPGRRRDPRARRRDRLQAAQAPARPRRPGHPQRAGLHAPRRTARRLQRDHGFGPRRPARTSRRSCSSSRAGPGTGKSVIAVNLVAELSALGLQTLHLTGSKAFTENLRKIVGGAGRRAVQVLPRHRDRRPSKLDVAILDEAHRIRTISTSRFTPAKARTGKAQIDDILDSSRRRRLLHRRPPGRPPGRGRQHRPDPRGGRQARRSRSASSSSRRSSARTAPIRSSSGSTTRSSSPGRRRSSGRWTTSSTSGSSASVRELERMIRAQGRRRGRPPGSSPASAGPGPTPTTTASSCRTSG